MEENLVNETSQKYLKFFVSVRTEVELSAFSHARLLAVLVLAVAKGR
jgi:hypothetical protein